MGRNERAFAILMLCGIVGVCFAILLQLLYNEGILIDEFTTGTIVLRELQLGSIVLAEIFGLTLAALKS